MSHVLAGGRPEVPPREALPGPDTAAFAGLDEYVALMQQCWAQDPGDRPTFQQIVPALRWAACAFVRAGGACCEHSLLADCKRTCYIDAGPCSSERPEAIHFAAGCKSSQPSVRTVRGSTSRSATHVPVLWALQDCGKQCCAFPGSWLLYVQL